MIYNQDYNTLSSKKLELIQYKTALAVAGTIKGTSEEKLYQEISFESLQNELWYRKLCCFHKIVKEISSNYVFRLIPK